MPKPSKTKSYLHVFDRPDAYAFVYDPLVFHKPILSHRWHWTSLLHLDETHEKCSFHWLPVLDLQDMERKKTKQDLKILKFKYKEIRNYTKFKN